MRRHIFRALYAAVAVGIALTTFGLAGAGAQATAAGPSLSPPVYSDRDAGYHTWGRWFRFAAKGHGYLYFTANDLTQGITKTARVKSGSLLFNSAELISVAAPVQWPPADIRLWKVADTRLTTYTGVHSAVTGPWRTGQMILTTDGTAKGRVAMSPSGLWNGDQNFGIWLRHR